MLTLSSVMNHTSAILTVRGEAKVPDITIYPHLLHEAMLDIANRSIVLSLLTDNADDNVLRKISTGRFIKTPRKPVNEDDNVELDDELAYAASNMVAAYVAREDMNVAYYTSRADGIISSYDFKIYNTTLGDCTDA